MKFRIYFKKDNFESKVIDIPMHSDCSRIYSYIQLAGGRISNVIAIKPETEKYIAVGPKSYTATIAKFADEKNVIHLVVD